MFHIRLFQKSSKESVQFCRRRCSMEHKTITEFQLVDINRLVPYINNARTHSPEQINKLRASLREFGFVNPIIVDRDYNVLAGHGRLIGAKAEGYKEVPCVFVDEMTEAKEESLYHCGQQIGRAHV